MPIYEYRCPPCDLSFETLVRSSSDTPRCPRCGGIDLAKQFSVPAAAQTGRPGSALPVCNPGPAAGGCGAPQCGGGFCGMG